MQLQRIKPSTAAGPDGIQARFLKEFAPELSPALTIIFQASLEQSSIPTEWSHAYVTPIYKSGKTDRGNPENYRPVSLTSIVCKTMEHILYSNIINHLDENNILTDMQHGFRKNHSCESQLLLSVNDFAINMNNGEQIDSILLDFSKAFDKVNHRKLCQKLHHYGIRGKNLNWIKCFLMNRTQQVVLNGKKSSIASVTSGVPQGTVLAPILFLIYINDLTSYVNSTIRLFADDAYLYRKVETQEDPQILRKDLENLEVWEKMHDMEFHPDKCKVLRITAKTKPIVTKYELHNEKLKCVDEAKYLGVIIHKKLSWKPHVHSICKKARQIISFLQRNLKNCEKNLKEKAYKIYVQPILNYASCVWNPVGYGNKGLEDEIGMIERRGARFVYGDWRRLSSPTLMISDLAWISLKHQRKIKSLIMMMKIINKQIAIPTSILPKRSRSCDIRFQKKYGRVNVYLNSFVPITIDWWNKLPSHLVNLIDIEKFRKDLHSLYIDY